MKKRFYKDTYQMGYNTRDDAEGIPFESCQSLVNARPGAPNPTPREGITQWNSTDDIGFRLLFAFPFKTATEKYLVYGLLDGSINYKTAVGAQVEIAPAGTLSPDAGETYTCVRIKNTILVLGSLGFSYILTLASATWTIRLANIARQSLTITAASGGVGTAIPAGKFVSFAATLVNRSNDLAAFTGGDTSNPQTCDLDAIGFNPGVLESVDDLDERVVFENATAGTLDVDLEIEIGNTATLDPQISHIRIYVTDPQTTAVEAEGAEHKWLADIPVKGVNATGDPDFPGPGAAYTYTHTFDQGTVAGALDVMLVVGYDAIPACKYAIFHQGRLWVGGMGTEEALGRWYYSEIPLDLEYPLKWHSMFRTATYFKDTSLDNSDSGSGMGISRNDLVFVMENSVWSLRDGDPDFEPQLIDATNGSRFPGTLTNVGRDLMYLGNNGPVLIAGREAVAMEDFTAGEVWPLSRGQVGYFHGLSDKTVVQAFHFRETFFIGDEVKIIGHYMPNSSNGRGPWSVKPAVNAIKIGYARVFDADTCVIISRTQSEPLIYQFLKAGESQDLGANYFIRSKSKVFLVDARNRDQAGELYDILMNASFSDARRFDIFVNSAYFRYRWEGSYHETPNTDDLTDASIDTTWRMVLQQGFPEGLVGFGFDVEWVKEFATPFDFDCSGFALRLKPVGGHPLEYVSSDMGSGPVENGTDIEFWLSFDFNDDEAEDLSPANRPHTFSDAGGAASRTYDATMPPSGGQQLVGSLLASGYRAATWDGLSALGIKGLTREFVVKPSALTRTEWLELAGDGTYFYGIKVTPLGALVLAVYSATVKATYSTGNGVMPVIGSAGMYTIQVTLSADMLTCRFYVAARTAAAVIITPTAAVLAAGGPGIYGPGAPNSYFQDLFTVANGVAWNAPTVAGGRLTATTNYIGSALAIGSADTFTLSMNGRLLGGGSYAGASLIQCGFAFLLSTGANIGAYVSAPAASAPAPARINYDNDTTIVFEELGTSLDAGVTFDFRLTVEISRTTIGVYVDGVLYHSYPLPAPITGITTLYVAAGAANDLIASVDSVFLGGIAGLGSAGGDLDLVEIPTRHVLLAGSSYGIAHARGLRTAKPATRALAFHNAIRGKTL